MSEQDWQVTVLGELGIPLSGLVTPDSAARPRPRRAAVPEPSAPSTAPAPAASSSAVSEPSAPAAASAVSAPAVPHEPFAGPADEPVVPPSAEPSAEAFGPAGPQAPAGPTEPPPADRAPEEERATPFGGGAGDRSGRPGDERPGGRHAAAPPAQPPPQDQPPPPAQSRPPAPSGPAPPEVSQPPVAPDPFAVPSGGAASPAADASRSPSAPPERDRPGQWGRETSGPSWEQGADRQAADEQAAGPSWEQASQEQWDRASYVSWERRTPEPAAYEAPAFPPQQLSPPPDPSAAEAWQQPPAPPGRTGAEAWQRDPEAAQGAPTGPSPAPGTGQGADPGADPGVEPGVERPWPPAAGGGHPAARELVRRSAHGDPLMRRMSRGVRRAVGVSAANDVRKAADVAAVLGRAVPSCRQIAVTSIRGGAGKTTVAGLTATAIAQYRQDRVLAVDADSGLGSLPLRMGVGPERSLHDLASAQPQTFEAASRYLARTADGLWVLSGTAGGRIQGELDLTTFRAAAGAMSRYFAATVIDCGAGLLPELQRGILADAHAQVMVTPGTVDGALSARGALEWQVRNGYEYLLSRTVVAFVTHTPHVDADLGRAGRMLSEGGLPVVHIPYDRHLATGTAVESARIGQETRAAMIRIAVEAFARSVSV